MRENISAGVLKLTVGCGIKTETAENRRVLYERYTENCDYRDIPVADQEIEGSESLK